MTNVLLSWPALIIKKMLSLHVLVGNVGHLKNRRRSWYETLECDRACLYVLLLLCIDMFEYKYLKTLFHLNTLFG